jgi:hypothetical protein
MYRCIAHAFLAMVETEETASWAKLCASGNLQAHIVVCGGSRPVGRSGQSPEAT